MSNWYYNEPTGRLTTNNRRVVYTEHMAIAEHCNHMPISGEFTEHEILDDWIITYWASPTDMPPGEYFSSTRKST